jgi:WhiB family transcriptional regulator, redox-sensing transcriptional regulator
MAAEGRRTYSMDGYMQLTRKWRSARQQRPFQAWAARLIADGAWRLGAACRSADPDLFFPVSSTGKSLEQVAQAKAICARCLVRRECLAFAMRTRQFHGIWGGLTEQERDQAELTGQLIIMPGGSSS